MSVATELDPLDSLYRNPLCGSLVFDIETGPQPWESIEKLIAPFVAPAHPGAFDPSSVKVGNLTEAKANAKIEQKFAEHQKAVAEYEVTTAAARVNWEQKIIEDAALDPTIGQVLAIGYRDARGNIFINRDSDGGEAAIIQKFWQTFVCVTSPGNTMIGHYIGGFDIPFLIRRSWILGIDIPGSAREGRYISRSFIDTCELWQCGERGGGKVASSLDAVARAMGVGQKTEQVSGASFHRYWRSEDPALRRLALEYLANDLAMNAAIAERMGVL